MIDYQHSVSTTSTNYILTLEVHHLMHHLCLIEKNLKIFLNELTLSAVSSMIAYALCVGGVMPGGRYSFLCDECW